MTYKSNVASGARDSFQTKYHMYVTTTGGIPTQPNVNWDSPVEAKLLPRQATFALLARDGPSMQTAPHGVDRAGPGC
ncbi:hypothetical protein SCWH03_36620 [Streptomyces pacificus]|uniref:Uncharacterized protein n=1 Tax=Streptomyces pacificus TaxID=2705029 RepID=A0A6A0AZM4_9ACTN|nr:hypothetical protein SCWH03_36620 [Streptomyces pacificus]